jgi:hypothetical protein
MNDGRNVSFMGDLNTVVCVDELIVVFREVTILLYFYISFIYGES